MNRKINFSKLWDNLLSNYWFVPGLMTVVAIGLSFGTITFDQWLNNLLETLRIEQFTYTRGPDGARALLGAIGGSMIGVAGVTFSITMVALTLASGQFGPRLLRNFMRDRGNQITLGTFISAFVYSLLVLRTVNSGNGAQEEFVPQISVIFAILFAIASVLVLIYFIHHVATSIQAATLIAEVGEEFNRNIERLFPTRMGQGQPENRRLVAEIPPNFDQQSQAVLSTRSGYIQVINEDQLLKVAKSHNLLIRLNLRPGQFVVEGGELLRAWPDHKVQDSLHATFNSLFTLGHQRIEQQDVEFSIFELVEIAARSLSPGINDPFTAIRCIDQLSAGLSQLAEKEFPSAYRYDDHKILRVITDPFTFEDLTNAAFNQIRQYGKSSDTIVMSRLLDALKVIATHTHRSKDRAVLQRHAEMVKRATQSQLSEEWDRQDIEGRYQAVLQVLAQKTQQQEVDDQEAS